jgi:prepilin-type N-terminal cleavage/methylation domain-containing protein
MKILLRTASRHTGFTLMELMITIAIIAVLSLLVFALGSRFKDRARSVTCSGNLRQIGIAMAGYHSDYNRFPGRETGMSWDRTLFPYLGPTSDKSLAGTAALTRADWPELDGIAKIFACPSDLKPRRATHFKRSYAIIPWTTNWSNGTQFRGWKNRPYNVGVPLSIVPDPARAATVVEWHSGIADGVENLLGSGGHAYHDRGGPDGADDSVHGRRQIVLFADGHTEIPPFMTNSEFVEKYWPGTLGDVD